MYFPPNCFSQHSMFWSASEQLVGRHLLSYVSLSEHIGWFLFLLLLSLLLGTSFSMCPGARMTVPVRHRPKTRLHIFNGSR